MAISSVLLSAESLEGLDLDKLAESVPFVASLILFVLATIHSNTDSLWDVSDSLAPDILVKLNVDSNILKEINIKDYIGEHVFLGKLFDNLDCLWSLLLELSLVAFLVKDNCKVPGSGFHSLLWHLVRF